MERHHAEVAERADRMHQLLRMLRDAEDELHGLTPAERRRLREAARAR